MTITATITPRNRVIVAIVSRPLRRLTLFGGSHLSFRDNSAAFGSVHYKRRTACLTSETVVATILPCADNGWLSRLAFFWPRSPETQTTNGFHVNVSRDDEYSFERLWPTAVWRFRARNEKPTENSTAPLPTVTRGKFANSKPFGRTFRAHSLRLPCCSCTDSVDIRRNTNCRRIDLSKTSDRNSYIGNGKSEFMKNHTTFAHCETENVNNMMTNCCV